VGREDQCSDLSWGIVVRLCLQEFHLSGLQVLQADLPADWIGQHSFAHVATVLQELNAILNFMPRAAVTLDRRPEGISIE